MGAACSVIIPACNEERYIARTLDSVLSNSTPTEVIVVLDSCTDKTENICRKRKVEYYRVRERKPSAAKNEGARHARTEYFIFLDADTTISRNALQDMLDKMREGKFGSLKVRPYPDKIFARVLMFFKNVAFAAHIYRGSNGLIFCRKSLFDRIGGFDEKLSKYEDGDFSHRASRHARYCFVSSSHVETSIRRFERLGYFGVMFYWLRVWLRYVAGIPDKRQYEIIR